MIEAGGSLLTVAVEETPMKNGGVHWHFRCPGCARRAKVLRLLDERVVCFRCCTATGLWYRRPANEAGQRALIAYIARRGVASNCNAAICDGVADAGETPRRQPAGARLAALDPLRIALNREHCTGLASIGEGIARGLD